MFTQCAKEFQLTIAVLSAAFIYAKFKTIKTFKLIYPEIENYTIIIRLYIWSVIILNGFSTVWQRITCTCFIIRNTQQTIISLLQSAISVRLFRLSVSFLQNGNILLWWLNIRFSHKISIKWYKMEWSYWVYALNQKFYTYIQVVSLGMVEEIWIPEEICRPFASELSVSSRGQRCCGL